MLGSSRLQPRCQRTLESQGPAGSDRLLHNLHGTPKQNPPFNRTQPKGRTIPITFANPEIIPLDC